MMIFKLDHIAKNLFPLSMVLDYTNNQAPNFYKKKISNLKKKDFDYFIILNIKYKKIYGNYKFSASYK